MDSLSASTAYASKKNIVFPGSAAEATALQARAVARYASQADSNVLPASAQVPTPPRPQDGGTFGSGAHNVT